MILVSPETTSKRETFFRYIYGTYDGLVCLVRREVSTSNWSTLWFKYPTELPEMLNAINHYSNDHDLYYCPDIFTKRERNKAYVKYAPSVRADLDECTPDLLLVSPTMTVESSPRRFQALWVLNQVTDPTEVEDISKRIARHHENDGADQTGWDLTQLLRVPFTYNHKYKATGAGPPVVNIIATSNTKLTVDSFSEYPELSQDETELLTAALPDINHDVSAEDLLHKYHTHLHPHVWLLYQQPPKEDWSKRLWQLEMLLFESGLPREEVFTICKSAACNKYERDGRSERFLWKEVLKAETRHRQSTVAPLVHDELPPLLTEEEKTWAMNDKGLVEEYVEWGRSLGDAAWQYHQAGAFVCLSTLLAGGVRLPTSFGTVIPNLWFMILADTTLTRKTTAMDLAMDLLVEIDQDCVLATDGSIEGLFASLSMRPGRPSIFLRDEFSGLLDAITRKDYLAGMAETLTKMYDGKFQKRVLRREVIEVREPILIMFAGGIKTRVLDLLTREHVSSGFLPRFVFITAESDLTALRPLGPPSNFSTGKRDQLLTEFQRMFSFYNRSTTMKVEGAKEITQRRTWNAVLTPEAWARYNQFENAMLDAALNSEQRDLMTPSFDRLSKSGLRCAVLLAAARKREETLIVEEQDIVKAIYYVQQWRVHTYEVLTGLGQSGAEKQLNNVLKLVRNAGEGGVLRSVIMRNYHLGARETDQLLSTLEQRDLITRTKIGARGERLRAIVD